MPFTRLFDQELRIRAVYPEARKETTGDVVRFRRPAPQMSFISYAWLDGRDVDAVIAAQIAAFQNPYQSYEWLVYSHDRPDDLPARLTAHGFQADAAEPVYLLDLAEAVKSAAAAPLFQPIQADIRPIRTSEGLNDIVAVETAIWGGDFSWIIPRMGLHLTTPGYLDAYAAYVDNQPVCVGWTYFSPGGQFGALYGGSTLPAYRGRGLYTAVLAARAQAALQRGARYLVVWTNQNSGPIVQKVGFSELGSVTTFSGPRLE